MEEFLEKPAGKQALEQFFDEPKHDLVQILLSISSPRTCQSVMYGIKVLQFFNKLFNIGKYILLIFCFYILLFSSVLHYI